MGLAVDIETAYATFAVRPDFGRPVTFEVRLREVDVSRSAWTKSRSGACLVTETLAFALIILAAMVVAVVGRRWWR